MGTSVFKSCSKLQTISLSTQLSTIPKNTFELCSNLISYEIPNHIKIIDENAFTSSGLQTIEIPSTIETINSNAFSNCMNLKTLSYPTKEITFNPNIFSGCTQLTTLIITGEGDIPNYEQEKQPWYSIRGRISTITLNENIETIVNLLFELMFLQMHNYQ